MNCRLLVLVILVLVLALAACDADDDREANGIAEEPSTTGEATATQEPEPSPTLEPEPTHTPPADDTAAEEDDDSLASDEDSGEDEGELDDDSRFDDEAPGEADDPFGTVPDVQIEDFHDQALSDLLLDIEQMPDGWAVMGEGSLPDDAEATHGLGDMMSAPCNNDLLTPEEMGNPVHAGRYFIGEGLGPFFNQDLYEFEDENSAAAAMELASTQLDCDDWTAEDPASGMEMQYTIQDLDFPDLGDDTVAISLSIDVATDGQAGVQLVQQPIQYDNLLGELSSELIMVRQGNVFSSFTYMNWFGDGGLNLEEIVTRASERVERTR